VIDLIYFYLFTNLRRSEAKRLEWWQVGEQYITVHIHKNDKKHGKPLSVVITDEIRELLKVMKSRGDSRWMFPSNQHGGREHINYFDTFWKRILREAGIENFHVHDLRKTFSAVAGHKELNIRDNIIGALMGHTPSGVTAIHYPHIDEAEKIEAAGKITKRIAMLLNASD
jgi:integrase